MTRDSKTVIEKEFKFFHTYQDALSDSNYWLELVDVEGGSPPEQVNSKSLSDLFLLKTFTRETSKAKFIETVYLKFS